LDQIEKEFDFGIADKSLNSLMVFQFNFEDLRRTIDFLLTMQKKQQFVIRQVCEELKSKDQIKIIEREIQSPVKVEREEPEIVSKPV